MVLNIRSGKNTTKEKDTDDADDAKTKAFEAHKRRALWGSGTTCIFAYIITAQNFGLNFKESKLLSKLMNLLQILLIKHYDLQEMEISSLTKAIPSYRILQVQHHLHHGTMNNVEEVLNIFLEKHLAIL